MLNKMREPAALIQHSSFSIQHYSSMSQSSEQIEAKLCAYLEGELDEQGRAEIEKHLAGNPAHRKLLAEVAGTRDLLRALPREAAPADLCETLQGHLERSVLLGDTAEDQVANRMRIFRWRPILAVAAMVVMAVGLGLVVYYAVPSDTTHNHNPYTIGPSAQPSPTGDGRAATLPAEKPEEKNLAGDAEKKADGDAAENRLRY